MKYRLFILFLITTCHHVLAQKNPPPVIQDKIPYKVIYNDYAQYTYTLDPKNISILKPKTAYLKVLTFESEKSAILEIVYNVDEVKLVDNDISKTTIKQKVEEIHFVAHINDDRITLTNTQLKQKIQFKINGFYDDLSLQNIKTKELFFNSNPLVKKRINNIVMPVR
jgi:ribosomal protein L23